MSYRADGTYTPNVIEHMDNNDAARIRRVGNIDYIQACKKFDKIITHRSNSTHEGLHINGLHPKHLMTHEDIKGFIMKIYKLLLVICEKAAKKNKGVFIATDNHTVKHVDNAKTMLEEVHKNYSHIIDGIINKVKNN